MNISKQLKDELLSRGAALVGFADLGCLPRDARQSFDSAIAVAAPHTRDAMRSNAEGDPRAYYGEYLALNKKLEELAELAAGLLADAGYRALAKVRTAVAVDKNLRSALPHKTVATLSGLGWIGRCATLVTREYGSAVRLTSVLTDAPLDCGTPVTQSGCGDSCARCQTVCPGHAVKGPKWHSGLEREAFFDAFACQRAASARGRAALDVDKTICGLCIANCPFTRRALGY